MIVDLHAHYCPKEDNDIRMRNGGRSLPEAARSGTARPMREHAPSGILTRLQQMDEAGVTSSTEALFDSPGRPGARRTSIMIARSGRLFALRGACRLASALSRRTRLPTDAGARR